MIKKGKEIKIKAWAKLPDCSCLGESLEIFSSKKEAKKAIIDLNIRLYGINYLFKNFKSNLISKVVPCTITYKLK